MKRSHYIIALCVMLMLFCPMLPLKGGIPTLAWWVSAIFAPSLFVAILAAAFTAVCVAVSFGITKLVWREDRMIVAYATAGVISLALLALSFAPIYAGGGWLDPTASKSLWEMMRTGM